MEGSHLRDAVALMQKYKLGFILQDDMPMYRKGLKNVNHQRESCYVRAMIFTQTAAAVRFHLFELGQKPTTGFSRVFDEMCIRSAGCCMNRI